MKRDIKPKIDESKLVLNPFARSLKINVNELVSPKYWEKSSEDGVTVVAPADIEYEAGSYCKVFTDATRRDMVSKLSARAKDLLMWFIYETETGKDWVWINKGKYMKDNGVKSINTYKSAVKELMLNGYISPTIYQNTFWINPYIFFNGSRLKKYPNNLVIKKK